MSFNEHCSESLLSQFPGDFVVIDKDSRYIYVNPKSVNDPEIRQWIIGKTDLEFGNFPVEIEYTIALVVDDFKSKIELLNDKIIVLD
jgi:hypothetical protein